MVEGKRLMAKIIVKGTRKYVKWLGKHLQKEHPKTKNKVRFIK